MLYMTVVEASKKWDVSLRQVQRLVAENRIPGIPGTQNFGRAWILPSVIEKPAGLRREKAAQKSLFSGLRYVIDATTTPMPSTTMLLFGIPYTTTGCASYMRRSWFICRMISG